LRTRLLLGLKYGSRITGINNQGLMSIMQHPSVVIGNGGERD
jgi:hypothetical protein